MANFYGSYPPEGTGGSTGILSINGDTTQAQLIVGGTGISVATAAGTTTITNTATVATGNLTDAGTDGIVVTGGTGAVVGSGTSLAQHVADTTHNGYLSSTDWNTFNGKQPTLTIGNLTDAGTDGITVTGGTGSVIGSGTSLSQHVADTSHNGYLSSTDWNTFNGKGAGTVTTVGAFSGSSQANGATISGATITFGPADGTNPGMVSTSSQAFAGNKTFNTTSGMTVTTSSSGQTIIQANGAGTTSFQMQQWLNNGGVNQGAGMEVWCDTVAQGGGWFGSAQTDAGWVGYTKGDNVWAGLSTARTNCVGFTIRTKADVAGIGGTTTASSSTAITGSGTKFTQVLGVGDRVSLSSAASTYATITAVGSDTSLTVSPAIGNGTSQTINYKRMPFRIDDSSANPIFSINDQGRALVGNVSAVINPSARLTVDNGSTAEDLLLLQSNGTARFKVTDAGNIVSTGTTSGTFTQTPAATTTSYAVIWPSAQGAANTFLKNNGSGTLTWANSGPTVQNLSSTGTYTTPDGVVYIEVEMCAGGGGGSGSGTGSSGGNGGVGGNTTFGTTLLVATGGGGGTSTQVGGAGGTGSLGSGPHGIALSGGGGAAGGNSNGITVAVAGGSGGTNPFGGAGQSVHGGTAGSGVTGSGAGGGGAEDNAVSSATAGSGGGAGGYVKAIIVSPAATYSYAVGAAGTAGSAGTSGAAGGAGGSGSITVWEYYS